jgi:hypothetical protein
MNRRAAIKLASVVLLVSLLLLAGRTCADELADITIRFDRGNGPAIALIEATLHRSDGEPVAHFELRPPQSAAGILGEWTLAIDPGSYRLDLVLVTVAGETVRDRRAIEGKARSRVTIDLSSTFEE